MLKVGVTCGCQNCGDHRAGRGTFALKIPWWHHEAGPAFNMLRIIDLPLNPQLMLQGRGVGGWDTTTFTCTLVTATHLGPTLEVERTTDTLVKTWCEESSALAFTSARFVS